MNRINPIKDIALQNKRHTGRGVYSVCSANGLVIEAAAERALQADEILLVEATANQVNQFGGYTGMTPAIFKSFVFSITDRSGLPRDRVILGGDHLGPLTWKDECSEDAMQKSAELIREFVISGFSKIHLDTSMKLGDDTAGKPLEDEVIARRGAFLCQVAEKAYEELKQSSPDAIKPVYIIGSEVPIPGGAQEAESIVQVTKPADFIKTVETFEAEFRKLGLEAAWEDVIGIVVQPGVEFSDDSIHEYDRFKAKDLIQSIDKFPSLVFEGHSTDFQTKTKLKEMVDDGIAILKVGPALTFGLREALFALNHIENELFHGKTGPELSHFDTTLEEQMLKHPENWEKHYHGDTEKLRLSRRFSLSDRCRYYLPIKEVQDSLRLLICNLNSVSIPLSLVSQYLPLQYYKIRDGRLAPTPESLLKDRVGNYIDDYLFVTIPVNLK